MALITRHSDRDVLVGNAPASWFRTGTLHSRESELGNFEVSTFSMLLDRLTFRE